MKVTTLTEEALLSISPLARMFVTAEKADWKIDGRTLFDLWAVGKSKRHVTRMRRQMAAARLE